MAIEPMPPHFKPDPCIKRLFIAAMLLGAVIAGRIIWHYARGGFA